MDKNQGSFVEIMFLAIACYLFFVNGLLTSFSIKENDKNLLFIFGKSKEKHYLLLLSFRILFHKTTQYEDIIS